MSPTRDPDLRLRHILDEAQAILAATAGMSFDSFRDTWMVRRAVEHGLLIITEASRALPPDLKSAQPGVPWQRLESLGNALRHEYHHVDPMVLWRIIGDHLPALVTAAQAMISKKNRGDG